MAGAALAATFGTLFLGAGDSAERRLELGPQAPVTPQDQGLGAANNSPVLVLDPQDPEFVALANRLDAPDYSCALHVSGDGGRGWLPTRPVPALPAGVEKCYAPEVAIDGRGRLYFLFLGLAGPGNHPVGAFLTRSDDRGRTFSAPRQVLGPGNFSVRMALDPGPARHGRLHLVWLSARSPVHLGGFGAPPNPILAAHSDDGGDTFSPPVQVSDPARPLVNAPALVVGRDRTVHVAYYDLRDDRRDYEGLEGPVWDGHWQVLLATSTDAGATFGPSRVVEAAVVPAERVMVVFTMPPPALAAARNRICVAWTDGRHGDPDALARCSRDRGRNWSPAVRLNDDPAGNGRSQYLPGLDVAPGGRVDAVFYDRRQDPYNANADVSYTFSVDGGRRFATNVRLTTEGMSFTQIGQEYAIPSAQGLHDWGSRTAVRAVPGGALAAWTDTHNSAPPTRAQDIFALGVGVADPERARSGAVAAGGIAAGATAGAGLAAVGPVAAGRRRPPPPRGHWGGP